MHVCRAAHVRRAACGVAELVYPPRALRNLGRIDITMTTAIGTVDGNSHRGRNCNTTRILRETWRSPCRTCHAFHCQVNHRAPQQPQQAQRCRRLETRAGRWLDRISKTPPPQLQSCRFERANKRRQLITGCQHARAKKNPREGGRRCGKGGDGNKKSAIGSQNRPISGASLLVITVRPDWCRYHKSARPLIHTPSEQFGRFETQFLTKRVRACAPVSNGWTHQIGNLSPPVHIARPKVDAVMPLPILPRAIAGQVEMLRSTVGGWAWGPAVSLAKGAVLTTLASIEVGTLLLVDEPGETRHVFGQKLSGGVDQKLSPGSPARCADAIPRVELVVKRETFWIRLLLFADIGFSEAFMLGDVQCEDLTSFFQVSLFANGRYRLRLPIYE